MNIVAAPVNLEHNRKVAIVKNIAAYLLDTEYAYHPGLMGGNGSLVLFLAHYYMHIEQSEQYADRIAELLEKTIAQASIHETDTTLASGQSGIMWLLTHLVKAGLLDDDYLELAREAAPGIRSTLSADLEQGNADLLQGFIGSYLALNTIAPEPGMQQYLQQWCAMHKKQSAYGTYFPYTEQQIVNLGLAHGLPGIGLFLLHQDLETDTAQDIADYLYAVYKANETRIGDNTSIFPNSLDLSDHSYNEERSRYAWCYGDLGILYFMSRLCRQNNTPQNTELLQQLVARCNTRNKDNSYIITVEATETLDPGFCHGLSGIYYLQQKINENLSPELQLNTNAYWLNLLLEETEKWLRFASAHKDQLLQSRTQDHNGLLEGISGAGMVLLSDLTGDHSWAAALLLHP